MIANALRLLGLTAAYALILAGAFLLALASQNSRRDSPQPRADLPPWQYQ